MRVLEAGHAYELENTDGRGTQRLQFVRRRDDCARLLAEGHRHEGVLTQEVLRVLIDRTLYLNAEGPCAEDMEAVVLLRRVLVLYESRAARRTIEKMPMPEREMVCAQCNHILCDHDGEKVTR